MTKLESMRIGSKTAESIRKALRAHLKNRMRGLPPGSGAFRSGRKTVSKRAEEILKNSRFGKD